MDRKKRNNENKIIISHDDSDFPLMTLSPNHLVEISKLFLYSITGLSPNEYKLFATALSKINPQDANQNLIVKFTLNDFSKLLGKQINQNQIKDNLKNLYDSSIDLRKTDPNQKIIGDIHLFSMSAYIQDEKAIYLKFNSDIKDLIFNIVKSGYIKYQLKNILHLKGTNSIYLYNYFLTRVHTPTWVVSIETLLKDILFIDNTRFEYLSDFYRLNEKVLKPCIKEINEKTNIKIKYSSGKKVNRKTVAVRFEIISYGNKIYIENSSEKEVPLEELKKFTGQFTDDELLVIWNLILLLNNEWLQEEYTEDIDKSRIMYFKEKILDLNVYEAKNPYLYLKQIIKSDKEKRGEGKPIRDINRSFDINDLEKYNFENKI